MSDPKEIYLQPECCADPETGRLWCEDPDPEDCEDGKHWARYVRADLIADIEARAIESFKDELVKSVKVIFRPHIEGVCAVVKNRLRK